MNIISSPPRRRGSRSLPVDFTVITEKLDSRLRGNDVPLILRYPVIIRALMPLDPPLKKGEATHPWIVLQREFLVFDSVSKAFLATYRLILWAPAFAGVTIKIGRN